MRCTPLFYIFNGNPLVPLKLDFNQVYITQLVPIL